MSWQAKSALIRDRHADGQLLDAAFGEKLISFRSLRVSICFSLASFCVLLVLFTEAGQTTRWQLAPIFFVFLGALSSRYILARVSTVAVVALIFLTFLALGQKIEAPTEWLHVHSGMMVAVVLAGAPPK